MDFLFIVLIIGFILIAVVALLAVISIVSHFSSLTQARANLENSLTAAYSTFETFAATLASAVERFVLKLRDIMVAFTTTISTVFNRLLKFATDFFTTIFAWVDHTRIRMIEEYLRMESKARLIITDAFLTIYNKLITIPIDVGSTIILDFSNLVTGIIHTIFCYVFTGFQALTNTVLGIVDDLKVWFNNNIYQPIASAINTVVQFVTTFPTTIQGFFTTLFNNITGAFTTDIINPIKGIFNTLLDPINSTISTIQGVIDSICSIIIGGC
jgi:methyl-accepting chemotaxis protein